MDTATYDIDQIAYTNALAGFLREQSMARISNLTHNACTRVSTRSDIRASHSRYVELHGLVLV